MTARKIRKEELQSIYNEMSRYQRTEGYIDRRGGKLLFFDSQPIDENGIGGMYLTIDWLKNQIETMS
jgi:hypothetical protein|tara:strand:+ start:448 stop:648 length:201 start_codon:yes stop_codon:yes gene_type:complete